MSHVTWRVRYIDSTTGVLASETIDAESEGAVRSQLASRNRTALSIRRPLLSGRSGKRQRFDVALFCEELSSLLAAGLNLAEALATLGGSLDTRAGREVVLAVLAHVESGKTFSSALEKDERFPKILIAAVRGGEHTSGVQDALSMYLAYHRRIDDLKAKLIHAGIYPAVVLVVGSLIVLFLLGYVVPRFATIYSQHAKHVDAGTSAVLFIGTLIASHWQLVAAGCLIAAIAVARVWRSGGREHALDLLSRLKWVRHSIDDLEFSRVFQAAAILLKGGFPLPYALRVASDVALWPHTRAMLVNIVQGVEAGGSLQSCLQRFRFGNEVATRLAGAGEQSGRLAEALGHVADHYSRSFARRLEHTSRLAEPLLLILVGGAVGGVVLMMYLPIFDLATAVGR